MNKSINIFDTKIVPLRKKKTRLRYRVAVIGGGSWATAIVKILSSTLEHIHWWVREEEIVEGITKFGHNPLYSSSVYINPEDVYISTDIRKIVARADYVIIVTPSAFLHKTLSPLKKSRLSKKKIINAVKGIVPESMQLITDYLRSEFDVPVSNLASISGPSHAEEVAREKFTYLTACSENIELAETIAKIFSNRFVRTTVSKDIMGAEMSIVLKNIYALGAGIYSGLGYGDNFLAAYIANCVKEMEKFINEVSRNRLFGNMIGHGLTVRIAQMEMNMIAEGYYACRCIHEINKTYDVYIPIAEAIYGVLYEGHNVQSEMNRISEHFI